MRQKQEASVLPLWQRLNRIGSKEWLAKTVGRKDDGNMIRFGIENWDRATVGWVTSHSRDQKNGTFVFGSAGYRDYRGRGNAVDAARTLGTMLPKMQ
jgi:hypothetical protein